MPPLTTCPDLPLLQCLLLGQIPSADAVELEEHIAACSRCAERLQQIRVEDPLVVALREVPERGRPEDKRFIEAIIPCLKRLRADDPQRTQALSTGNPLATGAVRFDFLAPAQADDELGRLGAYRVLRELGAGGMGVVFLAEDSLLKRQVALKVINPELVQRTEVRERFLREAQAIARVEHENIVTILHIAEASGVPFLAMPLLRGESLENRLVRVAGRLPLDEVLCIGREIACGLAAAHERGLVHRDVKPANIFLAVSSSGSSSLGDSATLNLNELPGAITAEAPAPPRDNEPYKVKLLDFGLARAMHSEEDGLSHRGQILGTPAYMAPEQGRGQPVDHRADLFSLGCILYRIATGQPPFRGPDFVAVLMSVAMDVPPSPRKLNPELPTTLTRLIEQLMAKNPEDRPASALAVIETLQALERQRAETRQPKSSRRAFLVSASVVLVIVGGLGTWWVTRPPTAPDLSEEPGEVTFAFDEPDVRFAVRRGEEKERILEPKRDRRHSLPPGTYRLRPTVQQRDRRLVPDDFVVKSRETRTVTVRLVGEIRSVKRIGFITGVAASPRKEDPTIVASTLESSAALVVWESRSVDYRFPTSIDQQRMDCVAFAPNALEAATGPAKETKPNERAIHLWDIREAPPKLLKRLPGHEAIVKALAYSPDGQRLVSGDADGNVFLWDLVKCERQATLTRDRDIVFSVAFSANGQRVLSGDRDGATILSDAETGKEILRLPKQRGPVRGVAFGPGSNEAVTACDDGVIRIWTLKGELVRQLKGHKGAVNSIAVSPDGKRLLSGGADGTIRLWDAASGRQVEQFQPGNQAVNSVAFTADGRRAVSGGADRALRLWELPE